MSAVSSSNLRTPLHALDDERHFALVEISATVAKTVLNWYELGKSNEFHLGVQGGEGQLMGTPSGGCSGHPNCEYPIWNFEQLCYRLVPINSASLAVKL